jgi:DNA helicase-2/ATP-dependent DNA helicase PcrA
VYQSGEGFEVVDWKTGRQEDADALQLAVYRLAWAEAHGLAPEEVDAVFHYVRSGRVVRPSDLPDRAGIEAVISGDAAADLPDAQGPGHRR